MPKRMYPEDVFIELNESKRMTTEPTIIPMWVPILLGIAIIGAFAVTLMALSLNKRGKYDSKNNS